jgi:acetyl-CoA carboxylase carboxyltransferase component
MGGAGNADAVVAWFSAELNFMDPRHAVTIVHGITEQDDPERYQELLAEMTKGTSAYDAAAANTIHAVINPVDTREYLIRLLDVHRLRMTDGVGQHLMRTWPTSH